MAKIVFKCLQCGRCCKNLLKETNDGLVGLGLSSDEKNLFPKELISPHAGFGWGTPSEPKYVVGYQLNVNDCPHLSKDNVCKIYDKRPLACQAFPLKLYKEHEPLIVNECTFMEEVKKKKGFLKRLKLTKLEKFMGRKELQAIDEIDNLIDKSIRDHPMDARVLWIFDLKRKEWHVVRVYV